MALFGAPLAALGVRRRLDFSREAFQSQQVQVEEASIAELAALFGAPVVGHARVCLYDRAGRLEKGPIFVPIRRLRGPDYVARSVARAMRDVRLNREYGPLFTFPDRRIIVSKPAWFAFSEVCDPTKWL